MIYLLECVTWRTFLHDITDDLDTTAYIQEHFKVSPTKMTWQQGREYCQSIGGDLAANGMKNIDIRR